MALVDLLRIADSSLAGPPNPQLVEDLLRAVVEETSSRAGVLRRGDRVMARWPRSVSQQVEEATDGWTEVPYQMEEEHWSLRLLHAERVDEQVMGAVRLSLRAWNLREELRRTRFDERFHLWELEAIRSIATGIGGILDPTRLAEQLINHLVALLGVRSAHLYLGSAADVAESVGGFGAPVLGPEDLSRAWDNGIYDEELVALPLRTDGGTLGVLVAAHKEARAGTEPFAANDVRLLELFAVQLTVAMEFARLTQESLERERLRRELEVAAEIQAHLFPQQFPSFAGFRLAAQSSPSRQVAGDTYDVILSDDHLLVTVADVSGKGVGAGMIASGIHASVRLLESEGIGLPDLACRINSYLTTATEDNRFATCALVRIDRDGTMRVVNAGHCPLVVRRVDGSVQRIGAGGLPLGILEEATYPEVLDCLHPGDLVLMYTDGLTEATNDRDEEFGVERVEDVVSGLAPASARTACDTLLERVAQFTDGRHLTDDATLLVVERLQG